MAYHRFHKIDTKIVRIFNTYGPRMRLEDGRVVPAFIGQALRGQPLTVFGDGSQTRSFCFVSDLIEGIYRLSQSDAHGPVNIGNPSEMTIREFAEAIQRIIDPDAEIEFRPLPHRRPTRPPAEHRSGEGTARLGAGRGVRRRDPRNDRLFPLIFGSRRPEIAAF